MHKTKLLLLAGALALLVSGVAHADHDEIGPVYKAFGQTAACMIRCNDAAGCGSQTLKIRDAEGNTVAEDYEPGVNRAEALSFDVEVQDGFLDIQFTRKIDNPEIFAIEIQRVNGAR